jgi:hypothetical protein
MATAATHVSDHTKPATKLPGRRYDDLFFSGIAVLILATVLVGFGPSYYFAGLFRAPLPSTIIHVHGAVFSCWILLLITQIALVSAARVDIHRRLGIAGFLLACLMVVVGVWAATDALVRDFPPGRDPKAFYIVPITDMVVFPTLIFFAFRARFNAAAHKRVILISTIALMTAPIARCRLRSYTESRLWLIWPPTFSCSCSWRTTCGQPAGFIGQRFGPALFSSSCNKSARQLRELRLGMRLPAGCRAWLVEAIGNFGSVK